MNKIKEERKSILRKIFEQKLQDKYISQANTNIALLAKNKRKREIEHIENIEKKLIVHNFLNVVEL